MLSLLNLCIQRNCSFKAEYLFQHKYIRKLPLLAHVYASIPGTCAEHSGLAFGLKIYLEFFSSIEVDSL